MRVSVNRGDLNRRLDWSALVRGMHPLAWPATMLFDEHDVIFLVQQIGTSLFYVVFLLAAEFGRFHGLYVPE